MHYFVKTKTGEYTDVGYFENIAYIGKNGIIESNNLYGNMKNVRDFSFSSRNEAFWECFTLMITIPGIIGCQYEVIEFKVGHIKHHKDVNPDNLIKSLYFLLTQYTNKEKNNLLTKLNMIRHIKNIMLSANKDHYLFINNDNLPELIHDFKDPIIVDSSVYLLYNEEDILIAKLYSEDKLLKLPYIKETLNHG